MYGYRYPIYRSPFIGGYGYPPSYGYGYPYNYGGYYNNNVSNIVGSAVADQSMNTIGAGAIGGTQIATPTHIW
jgi:hypothetical protein